MIVLDEDAVLQVEAMIDASAAADCVLVEGAQTGYGFARVEDFCLCAGDGFDELVSQGCDAAHALHEVENYALAGED